MASFKRRPVSNKGDNYDPIKHSTLDSLHNKKMKYFDQQKKSIPKLRNQIIKFQKQLDVIEKKKPEEYSYQDISHKTTLKNKIKDLEGKITNIENNRDELEYFADTIDILDSYYQQKETNHNSESPKKKTKNLIDFFNIPKTQAKTQESLHKKYIKIIGEKVDDPKRFTFIKYCPLCTKELVLIQSEGIFTCVDNKCGYSETVLVESDKPNYKENTTENQSSMAYKRINHFSEWINQFQAKESTDIPEIVYNKILQEINKYRIKDLAKLNNETMREILKRLGYAGYFEHIPHIIHKLNNIQPLQISKAMEETFKKMFREIQDPFERCKPPDRKNFLSYSFVLHKFCQLLELDELLPNFPLLKSRSKLMNQDQIWKDICRELDWQYIPSI